MTTQALLETEHRAEFWRRRVFVVKEFEQIAATNRLSKAYEVAPPLVTNVDNNFRQIIEAIGFVAMTFDASIESGVALVIEKEMSSTFWKKLSS
ncbi:hypothetical protein EVAR_52700_1 [Eumeta japonica]|uniref:Uncharacterized protein n=1 Tax=Eumeta variegata TaxID=151549 RepID=A0A4C1Y0M8_EUMVA|nr:hypothetical protein EVAR_52700_1 [Eumeta japonica]